MTNLRRLGSIRAELESLSQVFDCFPLPIRHFIESQSYAEVVGHLRTTSRTYQEQVKNQSRRVERTI